MPVNNRAPIELVPVIMIDPEIEQRLKHKRMRKREYDLRRKERLRAQKPIQLDTKPAPHCGIADLSYMARVPNQGVPYELPQLDEELPLLPMTYMDQEQQLEQNHNQKQHSEPPQLEQEQEQKQKQNHNHNQNQKQHSEHPQLEQEQLERHSEQLVEQFFEPLRPLDPELEDDYLSLDCPLEGFGAVDFAPYFADTDSGSSFEDVPPLDPYFVRSQFDELYGSLHLPPSITTTSEDTLLSSHNVF